MIYLDHNASSPLLPVARAAWLDAEDQYPGNPSSTHRLGARADAALDNARQRLATILGCSPVDLVWTSGATEACNLVLHHAAASADAAAPVWLSAIEHPAAMEAARLHFGERVQLIPVDRSGVVRLDWVHERLARAMPALVCVMAANNETGILQPWREVRGACAARGVRFFTDATQWCGRLRAHELGACDFVAGSAHKFGGPRGVGFLKLPGGSRSAAVRPLIVGGKQQHGHRAGTENVAGVLALVAALEWCEQQIANGGGTSRQIVRERFEGELQAAVPGVTVNGDSAERLWNTVNVVMPEADCRQRWVVKLDKAGFAVSTGSACSSGSEHPSHVLTAMGLAAGEAARALRFSASWLTTEAEWSALLGAVTRLHGEFQSAASRDAASSRVTT